MKSKNISLHLNFFFFFSYSLNSSEENFIEKQGIVVIGKLYRLQQWTGGRTGFNLSTTNDYGWPLHNQNQLNALIYLHVSD